MHPCPPRSLGRLLLVAALGAAVGCDALEAAPPPKTRPAPPAQVVTPTPPVTDEDGAPAFVDDPAEAAVDPQVAAKAKAIWDTGCARCHGVHGAGDGPAAAGLTPPPRDFHRRAWQRETADAHIRRVILGGGAAEGRSPVMAAHPELAGDPALVDALVELLRGLPHWAPTPEGVEAP